MAQVLGEVSASRDTFLKAYRSMVLARVLDEKFASLYRAGKIYGGVFLGRGQEALSAACGYCLRKGDVFAPLIRDAAGRIAFGEPIIEAVRTYLGSSLGMMRGRDGNVHRGNSKAGYLPMISHLGAMISVVNGRLMSDRFKGNSHTVGLASIGEGATSTGAFHEALNQAAVEKLPLVLVVANNQYAYSTPNLRQFACDDLVDRALGYGVGGHTVAGNDLRKSLEVIAHAAQSARQGGGPQLVVASLLRLCGHGEHDDAHYIDPKMKNEPFARDCVKVAEEEILRENWADQTQIDIWRSQAVHEVEETVAKVQREPAPDPYGEDWSAVSTPYLRDGWHGGLLA